MRIPRTTLPSTESGPANSIAVKAGFVRSIRNHLQPDQFSKILIITDRTVADLHLRSLKHALGAPVKVLEVPRGEKAKNLRVAERLWHKMLQSRADRNSLVVNFGGGSVCDVGGFAASTYMRGVPFINIPTTLLAQVDASFGGKNGINFSGLKNYIGTFKEPLLVGCDAELLATLPRREWICGYAEIIKHALICDRAHFSDLANGSIDSKQIPLDQLVSHSISIKRKIVESDPLESGPRKLLNLGHTIGHALEDGKLSHGEAVALGLIAEGKIAMDLLGFPESELQALNDVLARYGLPRTLKRRVSHSTIMRRLFADKKNRNGSVRMTLLKRIGDAVYDVEVSQSLIKGAVESIFPL